MATPAEQLEQELVTYPSRVTVVAGIGVSLATCGGHKSATWKGLLRHGLQRCHDVCGTDTDLLATQRAILDNPKAPPHAWINVGQFITDELNAKRPGLFSAWLNDSIGAIKHIDTRLVCALGDLGVNLATTNYDGMIEVGTNRTPITWRDQASAANFFRGSSQDVLHLHGYYRQPESVILGARSYGDICSDDFSQTALRGLMIHGTLMFVGCGAGLEDPNFGPLLQWGRTTLANCYHTHFMLVRTDEVDSWRERLKGMPIELVPYGANHSDLLSFVSRLGERVRQRRVSNPLSMLYAAQTSLDTEGEAAFDELLAACRPETQGAPSVPMSEPAIKHVQTSTPALNAAWIPCSRFIEVDSDVTAKRLLATVLQSALFAGPFFLPDSAYLNNKLLRESMRSNAALRQLVTDGRLVIARRKSDEGVLHLGEICYDIEKAGGRSDSFPREEFLDVSDLQFIDEHSIHLGYSIRDAELQYSNGVISLLRDAALVGDAGLPERIREAIVSAATEEFGRSGRLRHSFFTNETGLKPVLERMFPGESVWSSHGRTIRTLTKGPHITYLSNLFNVNPIFAPEHKESIDVWRKRRIQELDVQHVVEFQCRTGLATFVRGLLALTPDDLGEVLTCDECRHYLSAAQALSVETVDQNELAISFVELRRRIESRILKRLGDAASYAETGRLRISIIEPGRRVDGSVGAPTLGVIAEAAIPDGQELRTVWTVTTSSQGHTSVPPGRSASNLTDALANIECDKEFARLDEKEVAEPLGRIWCSLTFREKGSMDMQIDLEDR